VEGGREGGERGGVSKREEGEEGLLALVGRVEVRRGGGREGGKKGG